MAGSSDRNWLRVDRWLTRSMLALKNSGRLRASPETKSRDSPDADPQCPRYGQPHRPLEDRMTTQNSAERQELAQLRAENRRLREDVEILKRATAFFAKETR
jgi:transposase-like protein